MTNTVGRRGPPEPSRDQSGLEGEPNRIFLRLGVDFSKDAKALGLKIHKLSFWEWITGSGKDHKKYVEIIQRDINGERKSFWTTRKDLTECACRYLVVAKDVGGAPSLVTETPTTGSTATIRTAAFVKESLLKDMLRKEVLTEIAVEEFVRDFSKQAEALFKKADIAKEKYQALLKQEKADEKEISKALLEWSTAEREAGVFRQLDELKTAQEKIDFIKTLIPDEEIKRRLISISRRMDARGLTLSQKDRYRQIMDRSIREFSHLRPTDDRFDKVMKYLNDHLSQVGGVNRGHLREYDEVAKAINDRLNNSQDELSGLTLTKGLSDFFDEITHPERTPLLERAANRWSTVSEKELAGIVDQATQQAHEQLAKDMRFKSVDATRGDVSAVGVIDGFEQIEKEKRGKISLNFAQKNDEFLAKLSLEDRDAIQLFAYRYDPNDTDSTNKFISSLDSSLKAEASRLVGGHTILRRGEYLEALNTLRQEARQYLIRNSEYRKTFLETFDRVVERLLPPSVVGGAVEAAQRREPRGKYERSERKESFEKDTRVTVAHDPSNSIEGNHFARTFLAWEENPQLKLWQNRNKEYQLTAGSPGASMEWREVTREEAERQLLHTWLMTFDNTVIIDDLDLSSALEERALAILDRHPELILSTWQFLAGQEHRSQEVEEMMSLLARRLPRVKESGAIGQIPDALREEARKWLENPHYIYYDEQGGATVMTPLAAANMTHYTKASIEDIKKYVLSTHPFTVSGFVERFEGSAIIVYMSLREAIANLSDEEIQNVENLAFFSELEKALVK